MRCRLVTVPYARPVKDDSTYWSTIAQVTPVLFIGVMLEFRYLFRKIADVKPKSYSSTRIPRVVLAAFLLITIGSLAAAFVISIDSLRAGVSADSYGGEIARSAIVSAAFLALVGPGLLLAITSTLDTWTAAHRRLPWSERARDRRQSRALRAENMSLHRRARELKLQGLMKVSEIYVLASRAERSVRTLSSEHRRQAEKVVGTLYSHADEALTTFKRGFADLPPERTFKDHPNITEAENARFRALLAEVASRASS